MSNEISDIKLTKSGIVITSNGEDKRITNFTGEITEEIEIYDDEAVAYREVVLDVKLKDMEKSISIPVEKFNDGSWIVTHIGLDAEVYGIKHRELPVIINKGSKKKVKKKYFKKLGYHRDVDKIYYLHAGGSIASDGKSDPLIGAKVNSDLDNYRFPQIKKKDDISSFINDFFSLSQISPGNPFIGALLVASITRAPLTSHKLISVTPWFVGRSGSRKSSVAILGQQCFSPASEVPLLNFMSTPASTLLTAQQAGNVLAVTDDYIPDLDKGETKKLIEYLIGGIGNGTTRKLKESATKNAYTPVIKALVLMTAEAIPDMTQSRKERSMFCHFVLTDVDNVALTRHQLNSKNGDYAKVILIFIRFT